MKALKLFALIIFATCVAGATYGLAASVGERLFFDKLYYQKTGEFGYVENQDYTHAPILSERMTGLSLLTGDTEKNKVLGDTTPAPYTIVVIGDSYVWGLGVKIKDRFSEILAHKLNAVRPTRVYTLGKPADNLLENLSKYYLVSQTTKVDLYIFPVIFNDALMLPEVRYPSPPQQHIMADCEKKGQFLYDYIGEDWDAYAAHLKSALASPAHQCMMDEAAALLPHNAIYLIVDSYWIDYSPYMRLLQKNGLTAYELSRDSVGIEAYKKYWDNPEKNFQVSKKEGHPSKIANAMYANFLYHEIVTNPQWKFVSSP